MPTQSKKQKKNIQAVIGAAIVAALAALGIELASGKVPIPDEFAWVTPVLIAIIAAATPQIRGLFSDEEGEPSPNADSPAVGKPAQPVGL